MEYTKNYHLPQWVKSDRIMMEDFNQMCADMEAGLTGNRTAAKADTAALAQQNALNEGKAWAGLLRTGKGILNERLAQFSRDELYCQNGLLFNPLSSSDMAAVLTGSEWHETMGVYAGRGEAVPEDFLRAYCTKKSIGLTNSVASGRESVYAFTSPINGTIQGFTLFLMIHFSEAEPTLSMDLEFIAEKKSGSVYKEIYRKNLHLEREGDRTLYEEVPVACDIPLTKSGSFRLTLRAPESGGASGRFGFLVKYQEGSTSLYVDESRFQIIRRPITTTHHVRSFSSEGEASHALAAVRYRTEEDAPAPVFYLSGAAMTCTEIRTVQAKDGQDCREAWYVVEKDISDTAKVNIAISCSETDDFRLLEYAVMLL